MRLGVCVGFSDDEKNEQLEFFLKSAKKNGYDYVEMPIAQIVNFSETKLQNTLDLLNKYEINCECFNCFFPSDLKITGKTVDINKINLYFERLFSVASKFGAKIIVFGSGGAKNIPENFDYEEAFNQIVTTLKLASEYAKSQNITITIEPLNSKEANIITTLCEADKLMKAVDKDNIKLLVDYYHFNLEDENLQDIKKFGKNIFHSHIAQTKTRKYPTSCDESIISFIHSLKENCINLDRISIEANVQNIDDDLTNAYNELSKLIK